MNIYKKYISELHLQIVADVASLASTLCRQINGKIMWSEKLVFIPVGDTEGVSCSVNSQSNYVHLQYE